MKACAFFVVLTFAAPQTFGQGGVSPTAARCPRVRVICPDTPSGSAPVIFKAEVTGVEASDRPSYSWSVSAGTVTDGQGTSSVTIDLTNAASNSFTATVEVGGLSAGCPNTASCTIISEAPMTGRLFDSYGNLRLEDEKERLNNFAIELQNEPGALGYFVCYGGRRGTRGEAQARCERAKNYLVAERAIDPARLVTIDGGFREHLTVEPWVVPTGAVPPTATPTVEPDDVEIVAEEKARPATRRRPN